MTTLHEASRKRLLAGFAVLLAAAAIATWAAFWLGARGRDDSPDLLRQAVEADDTAARRLVLGKTSTVEGKTSSGQSIPAEMTAVKSASGRTVGYAAPRLKQPLKEGETASISLPGGGRIEIQGPPAGVSLPPPFTTKGAQP